MLQDDALHPLDSVYSSFQALLEFCSKTTESSRKAMGQRLNDALITTTVCGVTVLSIFLTGATTVAITSIGNDLKFKQEDLQWPLNVYALSYGCLLLLCGRLADTLGSKKMFLLGSAWFSVWSVGAALAPKPWAFILFLGFQGIGSAAIVPAGISIISSYFPPGPKKNQAFSVLGAGQPIGYIAGMILGGMLAQSGASWRAIFYLQAGLGALLCLAGSFVLPPDDEFRRYSKGIDWVGAFLSISGLGLLVYSLGESTVAPHGWATPFVPSILGTSILILISFVLWELRREGRNQSVLLPMSMWSKPGAKMGPIILLVVFAWWAFNTHGYFVPLFYEQVQLMGPMETAIHLIPSGVSGLITNILTGYLIAVVPGQILVLGGLMSCMASCIIFAFIKVNISYWAMAFIVTTLLPILDVAYTVANIQVCTAFDGTSQALAGSIFSVATRLGTSIGLAITSSIANSVSQKYNKSHPELEPTDPQVLMPGFRAAAWTCFGALCISFVIAVFGMRGIGLVGQTPIIDSVDNKSEHELSEVVASRTSHDIESVATRTDRVDVEADITAVETIPKDVKNNFDFDISEKSSINNDIA
ncbi:major facilitator superfamily domain-containing protein [Abortiporus biennis]|nr:major facilitator superfamily domain-containing protein [Abortiporus biennis]